MTRGSGNGAEAIASEEIIFVVLEGRNGFGEGGMRMTKEKLLEYIRNACANTEIEKFLLTVFLDKVRRSNRSVEEWLDEFDEILNCDYDYKNLEFTAKEFFELVKYVREQDRDGSFLRAYVGEIDDDEDWYDVAVMSFYDSVIYSFWDKIERNVLSRE